MAEAGGLSRPLVGEITGPNRLGFRFKRRQCVARRTALGAARDDGTALTNLFSGRPARGLMNRIMREIGPMSNLAPAFPTAGGALAPLKAAAEARG